MKRYEHEKSRPIMSDFSMFYTGWHQLSPIGYLPMQKRAKIWWRRVSVVTAPVTVPR